MGLRCRALAGVSSALVLAATILASDGASASAPTSKSGCDGVHLVGGPTIVIGIGPLVLDISNPLDDSVLCQLVDLPRLDARGKAAHHCENADVPGQKLRPRVAAEAVRCLIDKERVTHGLHALGPQKSLLRAAKRHTGAMLSKGCFAHTCPGEPDLVGRVTDTGYLPCNCNWSVGENIAWASGKNSSPAGIVAAWMASPPHREMILTGSMNDVDVGVRPGKPGKRKAHAATYTADFGYRN